MSARAPRALSLHEARALSRSLPRPAALALALSLRYANVLRGILSSGTIGDAERQFVAHFRQTHAIGDAEHAAAARALADEGRFGASTIAELSGGPSPRLRWWTRRNRESDGSGGLD